MTRRKYAVLIAVALFVAAGSLSGCGSGSMSASSPGQTQVAKASVTIAAKFPTQDGAVKSLIPTGAQAIEVYIQSVPYTYDPTKPNGTLLATLTLAEQSKTVQIAPGTYMVVAIAYDSTDPAARKAIGQTSTGGEIKSGQPNTIVLTFLDGQWTIVDANDTASPLVLSNGTLLKDFIVTSDGQQPMYKAGKSSIDYTKPVGGGSGILRLRFDNNTSARTYGNMMSQFVGTGNSTSVSSDSYNLTQKCGFNNYYGIPCDETAGDQVVMISSKDDGNYQSGGPYMGTTLYGSAESLLPGGGRTSFTQNGAAVDLTAAMPDTFVTGGTVITGGIVEWKPATNKSTMLGTPATVTKMVKSTLAVKAQSANSGYPGLIVKNYETIVCSGTTPKNRGTWSFANNTSAGKVVLGSRVCYTNYPYPWQNSQYDPITMQYITNAGDYSYGFVPTDINNLGDYCHQWNYQNNVCMQRLPSSGDIYIPWNFQAVASAMKTSINYGSFKFSFWSESSQTGTAYIYPFRAKGSRVVTPAK